jgi:hypothetical protein
VAYQAIFGDLAWRIGAIWGFARVIWGYFPTSWNFLGNHDHDDNNRSGDTARYAVGAFILFYWGYYRGFCVNY